MRSLGKTHLVRLQGGLVSVRGVLQVHSAPPALSPHIEWAVAGVLGVPIRLPWVDQPASPGMLRAELDWQGRPGASAAITSALAAWNRVRFEVTEEASPGCDAVRYSHTPTLGTFSAVTSANGDILVPEGRLRAALTLAAAASPAPSLLRGVGPEAAGDAASGGRPAGTPRDVNTLRDLHSSACPAEDDPPSAPRRGASSAMMRHPALGGSLEAELALLLGQPWDDELEPFRHAAEGAPVRWLHATG
jgi:hypothetical protein